MAGTFKRRTKRISLGFLGDAWQDAGAFIDTRFLTIPDSREIIQKLSTVDTDERAMEESLATVQRLFLSGKTIDDDGNLIDLSVEDLELAFDAQAILAIYGRCMGYVDPKASPSSTTTTPGESASPSSDKSSDTEKSSD